MPLPLQQQSLIAVIPGAVCVQQKLYALMLLCDVAVLAAGCGHNPRNTDTRF
jgi:hypothetical protein